MAFLLGLLLTIEVVVAVLMVAVVMLQPPKDQSGGMGSAFGGGFEETFGGRTGNVLSRATVVLGIILILNSLTIAFCMRGGLQAASLADREAPAPAAPTAPAEVPAQ
jgi:preprotein translocase subunit SecG